MDSGIGEVIKEIEDHERKMEGRKKRSEKMNGGTGREGEGDRVTGKKRS